jgi:hypothetical protein
MPTKGRTFLHSDGIGLLPTRASDGSPLEEAIDRHDAAPQSIGVADRRQAGDALSLSVDRRPPRVVE